jgi:hypothetical protein
MAEGEGNPLPPVNFGLVLSAGIANPPMGRGQGTPSQNAAPRPSRAGSPRPAPRQLVKRYAAAPAPQRQRTQARPLSHNRTRTCCEHATSANWPWNVSLLLARFFAIRARSSRSTKASVAKKPTGTERARLGKETQSRQASQCSEETQAAGASQEQLETQKCPSEPRTRRNPTEGERATAEKKPKQD